MSASASRIRALELLTRRFDVGPVDRVRLPAPAVAVVGQVDGPGAPVKMAARPVVTRSKRPRWTDVEAGSTPIRAAYLTELHAVVLALE